MRRRRVSAEKQTGNQTATLHSAREIAAARIKSAKWNKIPVGRNITVTTENTAGALIEIGDHHDVGLVIASARFQPRFPFTHIVGCSHVCVPVRATYLQTAEFVDQEEVDHASNRVRTVHSRRAILQNID